MARKLTIQDTDLDTWFERDRAHVDLKNKRTGETIVEWWDEAVEQAVEDGFLDPRDYHRSAFEYAETMGLTDGKNRHGLSISVADDDDEDDDDIEDEENEDGDPE